MALGAGMNFLNLSFCLCSMGSSSLKVKVEIFKRQCGLMSAFPTFMKLEAHLMKTKLPLDLQGTGNHR